MIRLLSAGLEETVSTEDIISRALDGDPTTLRVIDDAGNAVGRVLANISNLVSPDVIVIGCPLAALGKILLAPVRGGLLHHAVRAIREHIKLSTSSLSAGSEAVGAISLVFQ